MMSLSKSQSRQAALLILAAATLLVLALLSLPMISLFSSQTVALERTQGQLVRYRQLADSQDSLEQQLKTLKRQSPAAAYFVAGETAALASAGMQQYLKQIVERNGGELISTQILEEKDTASNHTILKVTLRASMEKSPQILYALEAGRPLLFLDDLVISARRVRGATAGASPQISLDMSFELSGYTQEGA